MQHRPRVPANMKKTVFIGPAGQTVLNASEEYLRDLFVTPPSGFWALGSGDAEVQFYGPSGEELILVISPHENLGYYLKVLQREGRQYTDTWLSLHDRSKLA